MCHGRIAPKSTSTLVVASVGHGVFLPLVILSSLLGDGLASVCPLPPEPENGGYICHPRPCRDPLTAGSVIEYLCAEGYVLKGDYKYLTCRSGQWKPAMDISCRLNEDKDTHASLGAPTLSIVASTASSVALILLLVVLFVLLQPKLKSFHHSRRDQGVSRDQVSIVVDGVQVALPSYEEAVYGSSGHCVPPADPRVQIVLSEGSGPGDRSGPREQQPQDLGACSPVGGEEEAPGQSGLCEAWGTRGSETVVVHQAASSSWVAGSGGSRLAHKEAADTESSDIQSLLSLTSEEYTDDIPLLKEA
ncbi:sushi domain-containing protein 6 [Carlito syrichta]|uniref:Sushi domain-containing protein 6 n=1 Tax=Carlito syrichta TaxID=1868482 RepID=A0A1U7T6E3_CARSF|nr:sushi domain-containing protein 6 [Carlito syrichta]